MIPEFCRAVPSSDGPKTVQDSTARVSVDRAFGEKVSGADHLEGAVYPAALRSL